MSDQTVDRRACACGTLLSASNKTSECSVCEALRCDAEILNDRRAGQVLKARLAAAVYAHPDEFPTKEHYLLALTHALDEMCDALGMARPVFVKEGA